ncbi:MAG: Tim44-like domain-containing protein, partial [Burkholderiales bacterium]
GKRWLAPLAGLAAGLGLAALASHFGFGDELASFMLIALLALVAVVVVRMLMSRRSAAQPQPAYAGAYRTTGLGQEASVPNWQPVPASPASSAQPVDVVRAAAEPVHGAVPAGFDVEGFERSAKVYFVRLQAAFDAGDVQDLREFTSPEMFAELKLEIDERQGRTNRTDVVTLDGRLIGVETGPTEHLASVRFSGMLREEAGAAAEPFDEVWNFARPADGSGGWVLAGIQQLAKA